MDALMTEPEHVDWLIQIIKNIYIYICYHCHFNLVYNCIYFLFSISFQV